MPEIVKISVPEYNKFKIAYYNERAFPHERFGQAFLNKFYPDLVRPTLFYETNDRIAAQYICTHFVEY